jgi:miniconductance mechanosensitive channel
MSSVRFCTDEMIERFKKIQFLRNYIESKEKESSEYNATHGIDDSVLVNGRRMTNLGTFRAYILLVA